MTVMAILQDVDKCMRCNGCVVACKREWNLRAETIGVHNVAYDQRLAIKSQKRVDMGPFMRYSCWHCVDAPCARACPITDPATGKAALTWNKDTGAVAVDPAICDPAACSSRDRFGQYPCQVQCQRGGYPKIGQAYVGNTDSFMNKCILCAGRAGSEADVAGSGLVPLQTRATTAEIAASPGRAHEPACVSTCPAKAMKWDTRDNILAYVQDPANGFIWANGVLNVVGTTGSMMWASSKTLLAPPKADPFIEDHVAPMVSGMLTGTVAKAVVLPTLVIGGLMAISSRRAKNEAEAVTGGEV